MSLNDNEICSDACEQLSHLPQEPRKPANFCSSDSRFNSAMKNCHYCDKVSQNFNLDKPVQQYINYCEERWEPLEVSSAVLFVSLYGYTTVTTHTGPLPTTTGQTEVPDATLTKGDFFPGLSTMTTAAPTTAAPTTAAPTTFESSTTSSNTILFQPGTPAPFIPAEEAPGSSSLSTLAIALICSLGGLLLLGIIGGIILFRRRRKQKAKEAEKAADEKDGNEEKGRWINGLFQLHEDSRPNELPTDTFYEADSSGPRHELPANELPAVEIMSKRASSGS